MRIGNLVQQPSGYKAFIPNKFPPNKTIQLNAKTQILHAHAVLLLGRLDGITRLLPDLDFFILMYLKKEATQSSGIEGTKATIIDVIKSEAEIEYRLPQDVDRILHYVQAMEYGLNKLQSLPFSLRFIRDIHRILIEGTVDAPGKTPGEFRVSQNWIDGGSLNTARFVPPPPSEIMRCLDDLEKFFYSENEYPPLIKAALAHAQFETIHPFLDGNGRTGRLLTIFYLCILGILNKPVLYLSEYFLNNRQAYYDALDKYHSETDNVSSWLDFFLDGVAITAEKAIQTSQKITDLRQRDITKIPTLGRRANIGTVVLENLYKVPIVTVHTIQEWTGLARNNANELIKSFMKIGILVQTNKDIKYGREFWYEDYLRLFISNADVNERQ
jgi:Fic family protein